jgi:hypothetical protein
LILKENNEQGGFCYFFPTQTHPGETEAAASWEVELGGKYKRQIMPPWAAEP